MTKTTKTILREKAEENGFYIIHMGGYKYGLYDNKYKNIIKIGSMQYLIGFIDGLLFDYKK